MEFYYDSRKIEYTIKYSKRKTIAIHIEPSNNIIVKAPIGMDANKLKELVESKGKWISNKLKESNDYKIRKRTYKKGELFLFLGKEYPLDLMIDETANVMSVEVINSSLRIIANTEDKDSIKNLLEEFYKKQTRIIIQDRIKYYQKYFIVRPNNIRIKKQKTRWGSCSSLKNLNFNLKLSMAKLSVIDYIVVHEMSHLIHLNHSKDFWNLVKSVLPNYKDEKDWLKHNGRRLTLD
ncbi:M48 family metallopeptidase [Vallitalea sp.]|jgi:predicted metal-dependent hydrolase|uniref:M48 family metallopeptidase n=1 Tax=Vallitalea sp. TaxID=1882829 RepID=UPI0025DCA61C|nr:SprT family zinc-dependent metalloprotease [Vallitalea sp.]MCT4687464.1 M48 family metallopeptidase [Vallitalea sp.]